MRIKVLITVKAYPALSKKYKETVCTAGITEEGKWIRIYPIPFRRLDYDKRFKKYQWIELDLVKNVSDFRPESYRPIDIELKDMILLESIPSDNEAWIERRKKVLNKIYTNLSSLIEEAKDEKTLTSLAVFKPSQIVDFIFEKVSGNWDEKKLKILNSEKLQLSLFNNEEQFDISDFELVNKLPYKFYFKFRDEKSRESQLMIEDWETGMLYWNCLKKRRGDELKVCEDVRNKYFNDFARTKDYYFILGTTKKFHKLGKNPFVIIGDFRPKHITQGNLFNTSD